MAMQDKKTEIVLASYNGEAFIREQIDSILAQTEQDWCLTLSDDGSTDGTVRILDAYAAQYPGKIKRVYAPNRFGSACPHFMWLMEQSNADYVFFCDQDDVWRPEKVQKTMRAMHRAEKEFGGETPILVFSDQVVTDGQLKPIAPSLMRYQKQYFDEFDYRSILFQNVVTGGAMACNRALAKLALACKDPEAVCMHDWWIATVAARFGQIVYIDEALGDYRQHGTNSVGAKNVGSIAHILHKLGSLNQVSETVQEKKKQAAVFAKTYDEKLTQTDRVFLEQMCKRRSGIPFYWRNRAVFHGFFRLAGMMVLG